MTSRPLQEQSHPTEQNTLRHERQPDGTTLDEGIARTKDLLKGLSGRDLFWKGGNVVFRGQRGNPNVFIDVALGPIRYDDRVPPVSWYARTCGARASRPAPCLIWREQMNRG
jgi:hypothetical protein